MSSSSISASPGMAAAAMMSAHRDVLEATPETPEAALRLVEELKSRARAAVSAQAWKDAELLYKKALQLQENDAVLYSNLSLVQRNMGMFEEARQSAQQATQKDPTYVKGFWRLGQALTSLQRTQDALEALTAALQLEPTNKALIKECDKLKQQLQDEVDLMQAEPTELAQPVEIVKPPSATTTTTTATRSTATVSCSSPTDTTKKEQDVMEDVEKVFTKSDHVKGYKTINGKKTSYFHHELSEEDKRLIGDIAPKRLDEVTSNEKSPIPMAAVVEGASVWNQAGTWEERNVSKWAEETLRASLLTTSYTLPPSSPAPGVVAKIVAVPKLDGHASYATVRGKKRYIYEYCITVQWELDALVGGKASGTMTFPDVDGTCELGEGYEMLDYHVDNSTPPGARPLLDRFVQNGGLRESLHQCIDDWVQLFRATY